MGKRRGVLSLAVLILCFSLCYLGIQSSPVYAGEGYGSHYAGGNEDFMAGALPPAGTSIFLNYMVDYNATTLNNNSGHSAALYPGHGLQFPTNFNLNVFVDAMRYVKVTKIHILGGDLVWHLIVPVGYEHVSLMVNTPGGTAYGPGFPSSKTGLGDIETGMGIAWHHSKTLHSIFGFRYSGADRGLQQRQRQRSQLTFIHRGPSKSRQELLVLRPPLCDHLSG